MFRCVFDAGILTLTFISRIVMLVCLVSYLISLKCVCVSECAKTMSSDHSANTGKYTYRTLQIHVRGLSVTLWSTINIRSLLGQCWPNFWKWQGSSESGHLIQLAHMRAHHYSHMITSRATLPENAGVYSHTTLVPISAIIGFKRESPS